jgi:hypothetical protein
MTLSGKKVKVPFGPPTCTICVLTIPAAALGMAATAVERAMEPVAADSDAIMGAGVAAIAAETDAVAIIDSEAMIIAEDCAVAKPARAETSVALEKYIFTVITQTFRLILDTEGVVYGAISSRECKATSALKLLRKR